MDNDCFQFFFNNVMSEFSEIRFIHDSLVTCDSMHAHYKIPEISQFHFLPFQVFPLFSKYTRHVSLSTVYGISVKHKRTIFCQEFSIYEYVHILGMGLF